ncbi:RNA polymerase sigma-70 factor [Hymenobacter terrenus]|uniref:RNA polymerase sigma-70 factor n=1 Tax=Hymenobacter terrenus TaxID=1629124 RepID=UPI0006988BF0|nr:RNA polymerase sigma-70 factor [Hymenobacter terrenus]
MSNAAHYSEAELVLQLRQGNEQAFEAVFHRYHVEMFRFALKYVQVSPIAEDLVHDVLLYLWERRQDLVITTSLKAYLYAAVKYRALDYLKSQYAKQVYETDIPDVLTAATQADTALQVQQLNEAIQRAIAELPEKCRVIYQLSRDTGLTYKEISEQLDLSPKTVEAQMGIALQKLRKYLQQYWIIAVGLALPLLPFLFK